MQVPDLISPEVWEKARIAFDNHAYFVAYNNTLLFVHEDDIQFFNNREDAADFAADNNNDRATWAVLQIDNLTAFKTIVEGIVPGLVYQPTATHSVVDETPSSFFPKAELISKTTIIMDTQKTFEQLKNKLLFLGFGEGLNTELERKLQEGNPAFSLHASTEFGSDKMEAVLNFRFAEKDGKENYFLNNYVATLSNGTTNPSQFFYVNNQGQSITFKEACNLLNGRAVFKELTTRTGESYKAWVKIDREHIDQKTGYPKLQQFGEKLGYDLKEALGRLPFTFLHYGDQVKKIMKSLEKGNQPQVALLKDGNELTVSIEANPQFKSINMYDKNGEIMYYPRQKVETQYGQAPVDEKKEMKMKEGEVVGEVAEKQVSYKKKELLGNNKPSNGLIEKKVTSKRNSQRNKLT